MSSSKYIQVVENIYNELMTSELSENIGLHGGSAKSTTLLEGIAGIGLALLSYLKNGEIAWDECLLLSS